MQIYSPETNRPSPRDALFAKRPAQDDEADAARGMVGIFALGLLGLVMAMAAVSSLVEGQFSGGAVLALAAAVAGWSAAGLIRALPPQADDER